MKKKVLVFLTHNMSLEKWCKSKILNREIYPFSKRKEYDFIFVSYGINNEDKYLKKYFNLSVYNLKNFYPRNFFISRILGPFFSLIFDSKLIKLVKECDLTISNQMDGALLPAILKIFYHKKFILRTGFSLSFFNSKIRKNNFFGKIFVYLYETICIYLSTKYTISSKYEYALLEKRFPNYIKKTFVVPNWINTEKFKPLPKKINNQLSLISIGRLELQKNPFDLILISKLSNIPLTIIGDGFLKSHMLDYIKYLKAPVRILNKVENENLPNIINKHSIYISTSLYEGSPKSILEAMSCALITIAYSAPGVNEIIQNKNTGFTVRPSPYILNNVITRLQRNRNDFHYIGVNARRFILENYSFDRIQKIQNSLYFN